jgi:hypothetical protein
MMHRNTQSVSQRSNKLNQVAAGAQQAALASFFTSTRVSSP